MFAIINLVIIFGILLIISFAMNYAPLSNNVLKHTKEPLTKESENTHKKNSAQLFLTPTDVIKSTYIGRNDPYGPYEMCGQDCKTN
jgi:hypothetical protein